MLERWSRAVLRWRGVVLAGWALVIALGTLAAFHLPGLLTTSLSVPGSDSARANVILVRDFSANVEGAFTVVVPAPHADAAHVAALEREVAAAAAAIPGARVAQEHAVFGLLTVNLTTPYSLRRAADLTATLRRALVANGLTGALVTGPPALQHDLTPILAADLRRGEVLALVLALALLVAVLGVCAALAVPFLVAAATTCATLGIVDLLARRFVMVLYIPNVVELIGLGLAIDYSLLLVHRFRAELRDGDASVDDAVVATMASAGRTVLVSGLAVAIGLAALLAVPVPFLRSLGVAGLCVPLVAMVAAVTLQPALLSVLGRRGVTALGSSGLLGLRDPLEGAFAAVTRRVLRRPRAVALVTTAALLAAASGVLWLHVTPASERAVPGEIPSARALALMRASVGPGVATPLEVVIDTGRRGGARSASQAAARRRLATSILSDPATAIVAIGTTGDYVDPTGRYERIFVVSRADFGDPMTLALVHHVRSSLVARARFPAGTRVDVGGAPSQGADFLDAVYGAFGWIVAAALLASYLVLARAFRSLTLPLVAVALDLLSVAAAYGLTVAAFRGGVGAALLGSYRVGQIEGWVPVFVFALLFGLSSDYEVFIVARVREAHDAGATTADAIVEGQARSGGVVSAAAAIMVVALSGLVLGRVAGLQELGVGAALGVGLDATLVRGLLLPSVMALLGDRCWAAPPSWRRAASPPGTGPGAGAPRRAPAGHGGGRDRGGGYLTMVIAKWNAGTW